MPPVPLSPPSPIRSAPKSSKRKPHSLLRPHRLSPSLPTAEHATQPRRCNQEWQIRWSRRTSSLHLMSPMQVRPAMAVRVHRLTRCRRRAPSRHLMSPPAQERPAMAVRAHRILLPRWTRRHSLSCRIWGPLRAFPGVRRGHLRRGT